MRLTGCLDAGPGAAPGLKTVSLELRAGQIIGLAGVSGNGQAALAEICRRPGHAGSGAHLDPGQGS